MVTPEEDESSKTEEPSERKISKAKEEGDIAVSQDLKSFIMLVGALFVVWMFIPIMSKWTANLGISFIEKSTDTAITPKNFINIFTSGVLGFFKIMAIPFGIFMVLGVLASLSQTGFIYAPKKLEPDWNKLNIFAAIPKFINKQKIVESIKGILKIILVAAIVYNVIKSYIPQSELLHAMISVGILKDGTVNGVAILSIGETAGLGMKATEEEFYGQFDGKTQDNYNDIDGISGATLTTDGYKKAILRAFESVAILKGGAE